MRGSGYQYVRSRSTGTYLRLPEKWKVADYKPDTSTEFGRMFDGLEIDEERPIITSDSPTGVVTVRTLPPQERDVVSFEYLRNAVFPIDQAMEQGQVEVLEYEPVTEGDFRGHRMVFHVDTEEGDGATIAQAAMVDPDTTRIHLLVLGCSSSCYEDNERQIEAVIESLTVKET